MDELNIVKGIIDLGTAGLLLYFLFIVWKDRKDIIKEKDERIKELSDEVLQWVLVCIGIYSQLLPMLFIDKKHLRTKYKIYRINK